MAATGNRSSGFDYLRLTLASSIILWHGLPTSYGAAEELRFWQGPFGTLMHLVLPMFFALSGFLVAGSLERCPTLVSFYGLRLLRILPALSVEILLSALLLGPALTAVPLTGYFASPVFAGYFLNLVGDIHYQLPGLFTGNPLPDLVNAQLWTIPFELQCYLAIGALAVMGYRSRPLLLVVVLLAGQALWIYQALIRGDDGVPGGASGPVLILAFLAGLLVHRFRGIIPYRASVFWPALVIALVLSSLPHGSFYVPLPAAYLTVYLGLRNPRRLWPVSSGDYSYGLYLYGYPIQQAVASLGPAFHHWWISVGIGVPATGIIAYLSWHLIERPALGFRRVLPSLETRLVPVADGPAPAPVRLWRKAAIVAGAACLALLIDARGGEGVAAGLGSLGCGILMVRARGQKNLLPARPRPGAQTTSNSTASPVISASTGGSGSSG